MQFTHSTFQILKTRVNRRSENVYSEPLCVGTVAQVADTMERLVGSCSERERERAQRKERAGSEKGEVKRTGRGKERDAREWKERDAGGRRASRREGGGGRFTNSKLQAHNLAVLPGCELGRDFLNRCEKNVLDSKFREEIRMHRRCSGIRMRIARWGR